jgi:hypothetical protein
VAGVFLAVQPAPWSRIVLAFRSVSSGSYNTRLPKVILTAPRLSCSAIFFSPGWVLCSSASPRHATRPTLPQLNLHNTRVRRNPSGSLHASGQDAHMSTVALRAFDTATCSRNRISARYLPSRGARRSSAATFPTIAFRKTWTSRCAKRSRSTRSARVSNAFTPWFWSNRASLSPSTQFVQRPPELRSQRISPQLFGQRLRTGLSKNAGFIGVMSQRTSIAS